MPRFTLFVMLVLLCFVCTCSSSHNDAPSPCGDARAPLEVVTFNAGLAPGIVKYATPRVPYVIDALRRTSWDVLCLQEVWKDEDRDAIVAALGLTPEQVLVADTRGKNENPSDRCVLPDVMPLLICMLRSCPNDLFDERMAICALDKCEEQLAAMYFFGSKSCFNCLLSTVGENLETAVTRCTTGHSSRIYHGTNGVMLLSRTPMRGKETMDLAASGGNHVALFATIDVAGLSSPLEIGCTHLSSPSKVPPTQTGFENWEAEQRVQLAPISARLLGRAGTRPAIFMGDLNTSDAANGLTSVSPGVWEDVRALGYRDAVTVPAFCTECSDNTLAPDDVGTGSAIDHVLIAGTAESGALTPTCAERLLDQKTSMRGYARERISSNLSDHYGLKVRFNVR